MLPFLFLPRVIQPCSWLRHHYSANERPIALMETDGGGEAASRKPPCKHIDQSAQDHRAPSAGEVEKRAAPAIYMPTEAKEQQQQQQQRPNSPGLHVDTGRTKYTDQSRLAKWHTDVESEMRLSEREDRGFALCSVSCGNDCITTAKRRLGSLGRFVGSARSLPQEQNGLPSWPDDEARIDSVLFRSRDSRTTIAAEERKSPRSLCCACPGLSTPQHSGERSFIYPFRFLPIK